MRDVEPTAPPRRPRAWIAAFPSLFPACGRGVALVAVAALVAWPVRYERCRWCSLVQSMVTRGAPIVWVGDCETGGPRMIRSRVAIRIRGGIGAGAPLRCGPQSLLFAHD